MRKLLLLTLFFAQYLHAQESSTPTQVEEPSLNSLEEIESKGWVLGKDPKDATCPGQAGPQGPDCNHGCTMANKITICYSATNFEKNRKSKLTQIDIFTPTTCSDAAFSKLVRPYSVNEKNELQYKRPDSKYVSAQVTCKEESYDKGSVISIAYPQKYAQILSLLEPPTEKAVFKLKKDGWYSGFADEPADVFVANNFCAKEFDGAEATLTTKQTGPVAQFQASLIAGKGSRVISQTFHCELQSSVELKENKISEKYNAALEANNELPPSKKKPNDALKKQFEKDLKKRLEAQVKCPEKMLITESAINLEEDSLSFTCTSEEKPASQLCPPNTQVSQGSSGGVRRQGNILISTTTVGETCTKQECYEGTTPWKGQCIACPEGTTFDSLETSKAHSSGTFIDGVLCRGPVSLFTE